MAYRSFPGNRITGAAAAIAILAGLSAGPALRAAPAVDGEQLPDGAIDKGHAGASDRVRRLGAWVDHFFADENYEAEINRSWLRFRLDSFSELYEGTDVDGKARFHLKLPALNRRLRFDFLSSGEPDDIEGSRDDLASQQRPVATEEETSAAVSYFFREVKERSIIARLGVAFDGYTPDPFVGGRYRELVPLNDEWNFRFTERIRFFAIDGLESRTSFDFERILEEDALLRMSLNGTWLQEDPNYFYSTSIALFQALDESSAAEFQVIGDFRTDPHRLERITTRIRHRQKLWRDWLTFEVAPQVSFPDERGFEAVPGILFRLELTFGG